MNKYFRSLIRGKSITIQKTTFSPPTLSKFYDHGLEKCLEYCEIISFDPERIIEGYIPEDDVTDFQIFCYLLLNSEEFRKMYLEALLFFTGDYFMLVDENLISVNVEAKEFEPKDIMTESMWQSFRDIVDNFLSKEKEPPRKPLSDKAKEIEEKLKRNKKLVAEIKSKQKGGEKPVELEELIAAVASYSPNYNLFNIWDLTYFQFMFHFQRLKLQDDYHFSLEQILAGVDPKKLEIKHWASSILKQD